MRRHSQWRRVITCGSAGPCSEAAEVTKTGRGFRFGLAKCSTRLPGLGFRAAMVRSPAARSGGHEPEPSLRADRLRVSVDALLDRVDSAGQWNRPVEGQSTAGSRQRRVDHGMSSKHGRLSPHRSKSGRLAQQSTHSGRQQSGEAARPIPSGSLFPHVPPPSELGGHSAYCNAVLAILHHT